MSSLRWIRLSAFVLYGIVFSLFIILSLLGICAIFRSNFGTFRLKFRFPTVYQFYRVDKKTGISTTGHMGLFEELDRDGYRFSEDEDKYMLISNIGMKEYRCRGSCYCEISNDERRNAMTGARTGLFYLVAAVSSTFAITHARKYFNEKCVNHFSNEESSTCPLTSVRSFIDDCKIDEDFDDLDDYSGDSYPLDEQDLDLDYLKDEPPALYADPEPEIHPDTEYKFSCFGNCVPNIYPEHDDNVRNLASSYGCEKLSLTGEITVLQKEIPDDYIQDPFYPDQANAIACYDFMDYPLDEYCEGRTISKVTHRDIVCQLPEYDETGTISCPGYCYDNCKYGEYQMVTEDLPLCTGWGLEKGKNENPTVVCKRIN